MSKKKRGIPVASPEKPLDFVSNESLDQLSRILADIHGQFPIHLRRRGRVDLADCVRQGLNTVGIFDESSRLTRMIIGEPEKANEKQKGAKHGR